MEADQGKRVKEATGETIQETSKKIGGNFTLQKNPPFLQKRLQIFDEFYAKQQNFYESIEKREIKITLKDGKELKGTSFETTPEQIAKNISKKLLENTVVAKVTYTKKDQTGLDKDIVEADMEDEPVKTEEKFELYDLSRPLEGDCMLELLDYEDDQSKIVFKHSSAHILGATLERLYGSHLCIGPPLQDGFYYDSYMGSSALNPTAYPEIEKDAKLFASQDGGKKFQRLIMSKEESLKLFEDNPFKVQLIKAKIPEGGKTSAYKCGTLIDLCTGPHIPNTKIVKAFKVTKSSSSYWLANKDNDDLQRVYGITFPKEDQLKEWVKIQEEIAKRDHRNLGVNYKLFEFDEKSPGSAFFYPHGAKLYNNLVNVIKNQYLSRGFQEVITPNLYNSDLWKTSGHYQKYKDNIFWLNVADGHYGLKPMNCPGHCVMFAKHTRSYKDLPLRYADFGVLHRNELHGALSGLTRVRRFQQDDAHIFCTIDQIEEEILGSLEFLKYIYDIFGFKFEMHLSTRPELSVGKIEVWDMAEQKLKNVLNKFCTKYGKEWKLNPGDGAFYGPKIDLKLFDALQREHQCGTVQLDFQLPIRFDLQYRDHESVEEVQKQQQQNQEQKQKFVKNNKKTQKAQQKEKQENKQEENQEKKEGNEAKQNEQKQEEEKQVQKTNIPQERDYDVELPLKPGFKRPIMVHRAVLGSLERMIAILTEHTGGKWPFWISPRQIIICPISKKFLDYGERIYLRLKLEGYSVEFDKSDETIKKKVRNAELMQFNYIAVVGEAEQNEGLIDLRQRIDKKEEENQEEGNEKKEEGKNEENRLGKFTIDGLLDLLKSQQPEPCQEEKDLWQKALGIHINELLALNRELQDKTFLEGEGFQLGARDEEVYAKLEKTSVDAKIYPNLGRWIKFMKASKK